MIHAWISEMEATQPGYGHLLQATVDTVGPLPAINENGEICTIGAGIRFWLASGFAQKFTAITLENMRINIMGGEYPKVEAAQDEEEMVRLREKARFYEDLQAWVEANEPLQLPMKEMPAWLAPFQE